MEVYQSLLFQFLCSLFLFIFLYVRFKTTRPKTHLPPGPCKLPFIGNIHNIIGAPRHRRLHSLALKNGPVMHLQLGEFSAVVISSADAAKQVLKTHDVNFASRSSLLVTGMVLYNNTDIVFSPYGEYWRQLKKILVAGLLNQKRVQSFRFIREEVFAGLMKWIASNRGLHVKLAERIHFSVYEVVIRSAFGSMMIKDQDSLFFNLNGLMELVTYDIADFFPSNGLVQWFSPMKDRLQKYLDEFDVTLEKIIEEHKIANSMTDEKEKNEDIVDILLNHQEEGSEFHLNIDSIKAVLMDIFVAAIDTSSITLTWAIAEMMKNPEILDKAQQEVRHVFDPKGYVDESDIDQLKYLKCVIKETLRFHPPVPLLFPRKCNQKCEINGYEIIAETNVIVNAWAVNRDPSYWSNPHCFQPERFLDNTIDYMGTSFGYIPFGGGRRICPGMAFGLLNVNLPLAMLLYHFDWTLPEGMGLKDMDMREAFGATTPMKEPLTIVPMLKRPLVGYNK